MPHYIEDWDPTVHPCTSFDEPWNGWATPVVTRDQLQHLADRWDAVRADCPDIAQLDMSGPAPVLIDHGSNGLEPYTLNPGADGLFHLAEFGFTFTRAPMPLAEAVALVVADQLTRHPHFTPREALERALVIEHDGGWSTPDVVGPLIAAADLLVAAIVADSETHDIGSLAALLPTPAAQFYVQRAMCSHDGCTDVARYVIGTGIPVDGESVACPVHTASFAAGAPAFGITPVVRAL